MFTLYYVFLADNKPTVNKYLPKAYKRLIMFYKDIHIYEKFSSKNNKKKHILLWTVPGRASPKKKK